jgi:Gpi18-like mannosyltransferase
MAIASSDQGKVKSLLVVLCFMFLMCMMPSLGGYTDDLNFWAAWAGWINQHGLQNTYSGGTNYTPLYQYCMWLYSLLFDNPDEIQANIRYIRVFALLFDFLGVWLVYKSSEGKLDYLTILLISMFNISFSYNTMIWGQVDAILSTLTFASFYFLYRGRLVLSTIMIVLAINMKLQGIVFMPLWGLLVLIALMQTRKWGMAIWIILALAATQFLLLLPFAFGKGGITQVMTVLTGLVGAYNMLTVNAFNIWYLIVPNAGPHIGDGAPFIWGLSYVQAGLYLFCISSFMAFLPLFRIAVFQLRGKVIVPSPSLIWLTAALVALLFFFTNTEMHERYSHPAFLFISAYAFYRMRFGLYILFSAAYFLNMERVLRYFGLRNYETVVFDPRFVAALFAICIIWMFVLLYREAKRLFSVGADPVLTGNEVMPVVAAVS